MHHCCNAKCKAKLMRDESGRNIFAFAWTRVLLWLEERKKRKAEEKEEEFGATQSPTTSMQGQVTTPWGDNAEDVVRPEIIPSG